MGLVLEADNLSKRFGAKEAVKNAGFYVDSNEIFALIGPNGAGKSTTIRMIATILAPTSGTARVSGFDVVKDARKVRELISYLPEEAGAYKNMTGSQYFDFMAAIYTDNRIEQKEYVSRAKNISNLGSRLKDKIATYSKGMARKLLLSRALMAKPKLAILDEPTSGLDLISGLEIRKIIKEYAKSGMAVLLSSHNMLEIEFLSDRVAIMEGGKIFETGTSQELKLKYQAANLEEVFIKITSLAATDKQK